MSFPRSARAAHFGILSALAAVCSLGFPVAGGANPEPAVPPLPEQLARAQAAEDHAAVAELCRRLLEQPGANVTELLTTKFQAELKEKDYSHAEQTLARLEKASLPAGKLADMHGELSAAEDRPLDETLGWWGKALAAHPADPASIWGKMADTADYKKDWGRAAEAFRGFLQIQPKHAARLARLAVCLLNLGQQDAADRAMTAATRLDSADPTVKEAAPLFDRLRPQLAALRALDARIAKAPPANGGAGAFNVRANANTPEAALLERALIFYRAAAYFSALDAAEKALEATGKHSVAALLLVGQCHWRVGDADAATALRVAHISDAHWFDDKARCDRLRAADTPAAGSSAPSSRQHAARAAILLEADQPVLALADAEAAAASPNDVEAQVVLAAALLRNDRAADALAAARRATELDPRNADGWALRGRLEQEERADLAAAVDSLSRALAIRNEPRWLRRREVCLRTLGRLAEADRDARKLPAN